MIKCNLAKVDAGFYLKGKREAGWKNREWWRRIEIYGDCCWILDSGSWIGKERMVVIGGD
jgi:hypothetical protein